MVLPDSPRVPRVPGYSGALHRSFTAFTYRALTVSGGVSQPLRLAIKFLTPWRGARSPVRSHKGLLLCVQPPIRNGCSLARMRFRLFPVRSPLLGKSSLLSFPPVTKMVQFTGCPPGVNLVTGHHSRRVSPFGNPGIKACLQLPQAFRRLLRPSSASGPKASTLRRSLLSLFLNLWDLGAVPQALLLRPKRKTLAFRSCSGSTGLNLDKPTVTACCCCNAPYK